MSIRAFFLCIMLFFFSIISVESTENSDSDRSSFHPEIEDLLAKTAEFSIKGYIREADTLAREITLQLLNSPVDEDATPDETNALIDAHLKTELYYGFNTKWGSGGIRNPRIIYDFLSQFDKSSTRSPNQREHLTVFTMFSLAAQEYFWNEKSTVSDLKNRIRRELRYSLFRQSEHVLDVSMLIHLDEAILQDITERHINDTLIEKLKLLMDGFRSKNLGATYTDILNYMEETFKTIPTINLPVDTAIEGVIVPFGFTSNIAVKAIFSYGDGMCGQYSLFIPTDGELATEESGIAEGNGRDKMHRAIFDHAIDTDTKRLYLRASQHMDGFRFIDLMDSQILALRETNSAQADELQAKMDTYKQFMQDRQTENEALTEQSKQALLETITRLPGLEAALSTFQTRLNNPEQLKTIVNDRNFRNIIDEIVSLRGSNTELERLLANIDADISRLNTEIEDARKIAIAAATEARVKAEENFELLASDFQQFRKDNIDLVRQHQTLFSSQEQFKKIMQAGTVAAEELEKIKENLDQQFKEFEGKNPEFVRSITEKHILLINAQKASQDIKEDYSARDAKLIEKYMLICATLKDFIGVSMLPEKSSVAFSIERLCLRGYSNFINDVCQEICTFIGDQDTATLCREHWDVFDTAKELLINQIEQQLISQRLEIAASLLSVPEELTPHSLSLEMSSIALRPSELSDCLPCDAIYTQLWAIINNLNIFVFSEGEQFGRSKLDLILRLSDKPYDQRTSLYSMDTTGKHLATVILTSPTAKNVFLDKSLQHYDKFILPDDYVAIAKQMRHVAWANLGDERYTPYPQRALMPDDSEKFVTVSHSDDLALAVTTSNIVASDASTLNNSGAEILQQTTADV